MMSPVAARLRATRVTRLTKGLHDLSAEEPIAPFKFSPLRRRVLLEGCKWDPQVGDEATL